MTSSKDIVNYLISITSSNKKEIKLKLLFGFEINIQKLFYLLEQKTSWTNGNNNYKTVEFIW